MDVHSAQAPEISVEDEQPAQNSTESSAPGGDAASHSEAHQFGAQMSTNVEHAIFAHITAEELQQQGFPRAEANRLAAHRNSEVTLRRVFLWFFRMWSFAFAVLAIITMVFFCILVYAYVQSKKIECTKRLRVWTQVLYCMIAYSFFLHEFVVRKICCFAPHVDSESAYRPEPPRRVKALLAVRSIVPIIWCAVGIYMVCQGQKCKEGNVDQLSAAVMSFCISDLVLIFHFTVLFTAPYILLQYAFRRGWLHGNEGAPKGTSHKLPTVNVENDAKFCDTKDDGCSVCLDEFCPAKTVVKKPRVATISIYSASTSGSRCRGIVRCAALISPLAWIQILPWTRSRRNSLKNHNKLTITF